MGTSGNDVLLKMKKTAKKHIVLAVLGWSFKSHISPQKKALAICKCFF